MKFIHHAAVLLSCALAGASHAQSQHSLVIGIDGMGYGTYGFTNASTPSMDSLINGTWQGGYNGAYANDAFSGGVVGTATEQITVSGPGWSSILTGTWSNQHGVTSNSTFGNNNYATHNVYLETLEENVTGIVTGSFVSWTPIHNNIIPSITDGDSAIDVAVAASYNDPSVTNSASTHLGGLNTSNASATFVHLLNVDAVGHSSGSNSAAYGNAITAADTMVGQLLTSISSRANFANEDWQIIITADHGHLGGGGHGGQSSIERTIPFIVSSSDAIQGVLSGQSVSIVDVAPTALAHFGLDVPENIAGVSRAVPEPSSFVLLGLAGLCVLRRRRT